MSERAPLQPLSASEREMLEEATATYQAAVTPHAARFLLNRGIGREVAAMHRLGVVDDPLPGHEHLTGFLSIPYLDHRGQPLSIRFRCLQTTQLGQPGQAGHVCRDSPRRHGKYMSLVDEPARVYNVGSIHHARDEIHITEGELDAVILTMIGLPAIAIPGASGWQAHHRRMLAGFSRVWVWGDPDGAGIEFTHRISRALRTAKAARLRHGDVGETYLAGGAPALYAAIGQEARAA